MIEMIDEDDGWMETFEIKTLLSRRRQSSSKTE
jgi:hypothetical protein